MDKTLKVESIFCLIYINWYMIHDKDYLNLIYIYVIYSFMFLDLGDNFPPQIPTLCSTMPYYQLSW